MFQVFHRRGIVPEWAPKMRGLLDTAGNLKSHPLQCERRITYSRENGNKMTEIIAFLSRHFNHGAVWTIISSLSKKKTWYTEKETIEKTRKNDKDTGTCRKRGAKSMDDSCIMDKKWDCISNG